MLFFCFYTLGQENHNNNEPAVKINCDIDSSMYELIGLNRAIDFNFSFGDGFYVQYLPMMRHLKNTIDRTTVAKNGYMVFECESEYAKFKTSHSDTIDFGNNILFVVLLGSYGTCIGNRPPEITLSLLLDKMNNNYIVSITHFIHTPYLKVYCPPIMCEAIIPKEYCNLICIKSKFLCHETKNN
jgi:hypothetical protein